MRPLHYFPSLQKKIHRGGFRSSLVEKNRRHYLLVDFHFRSVDNARLGHAVY
jgi:hypothetical protein